MSNKLTQVAREILAIEADLQYRIKYNKDEKVSVDDFTMCTFPQTWSSTALGFSGVGGQAITTANTYVFIPKEVNQDCFIYFGGRFAYSVPYCQALVDDVRSQHMEPVRQSGKYKSTA